MMTADEALGLLLEGTTCAACGSPAPGGEPCPECGAIPEVTGPELAAELEAAPLAVAEIEARQAIAEGHAQLDAAIDGCTTPTGSGLSPGCGTLATGRRSGCSPTRPAAPR
jgi:hypothetical protein